MLTNEFTGTATMQYKMVGITKHSPGHFFGDVFNPRAKNWMYFNSIAERNERRNARFTLKPILKKKKMIKQLECLIPNCNYVHYIRVE